MTPKRDGMLFGGMSVGLALLLAATSVYTVAPYLFSVRLALKQGEGLLLRGVVSIWVLEWLVAAVLVIPLAIAGGRILAGRMESRGFVRTVAWVGLVLGLAAVGGHVALVVAAGSGWPESSRQWVEVLTVLTKLTLQACLGFMGARSVLRSGHTLVGA